MFIQQIQDASEYAGTLVRLLNEREEQLELTVDRLWEEDVRADPRRAIVCSILMPPPIQALHWERYYIWTEIQGCPEEGRELNRLLVRFFTIQQYIADWLIEEMKHRPDICQYLMPKNFMFGVGANWRMLVVEIPRQSLPTDSHIGYRG